MRKKLGVVRRRELAEATFETMKEVGLKATTVQRVSARAGLAPGLVHHYFATKAEMVEAAIWLASTEISAELVRLLKTAEGPRQRLDAVVAANLAPSVFNPEVTRAWLAFVVEADGNPRYGRIVEAITRRMASNLRHALRPLVAEADVERVAFGIALMIDGAWMRCAVAGAEIEREMVIERIRALIAREVPAGA
jgi:transcriptional repressor BetI